MNLDQQIESYKQRKAEAFADSAESMGYEAGFSVALELGRLTGVIEFIRNMEGGAYYPWKASRDLELTEAQLRALLANCHHTRIYGDTSPCPECALLEERQP